MRLIKKSLKAGALLLRSTCPECQIVLFANESITRVFFGDTINAYMVSAKGQWLIFVNALINSDLVHRLHKELCYNCKVFFTDKLSHFKPAA